MNGEFENYVPDQLRGQITPIWDTQSIAAAATATTIQFFAHDVATDGRNVTNLVEKNKITGPGQFTIMAMRFVVLGITAVDLQKWYENYVLRLIRGTSEVAELEAPPEYWPGGAGIHANLDGAAAAVAYINNGIPDCRNVASIHPWNIKLAAGDHFSVRLEGVSFVAGAAHKLRVYLDGAYEKGIPT